MISVKAENLKKKYAITTVDKREKLKKGIYKNIFGLNRQDSSTKYRVAISGVSFQIEKGESLALIGRNGAGKSTLLKMIEGSLIPDEGKISVNGKVGGLVELNAGLVFTKTGYENAAERARLIGVPPNELNDFVKEIEQFSELGEQFHDPVNTYSSGMKARLGFGISVTLPFDIMICDEALSVGDANFSAKCLAKVNAIKKDRIFLFVSHSMSTVQRFCEHAIVLEKGQSLFFGESAEAIAYYENTILNTDSSEILPTERKATKDKDKKNNRQKGDAVSPSLSFLEPLIENKERISDWSAEILMDNNVLEINWSFKLLKSTSCVQQFRLGFPLFSADGTMLFSCTNENVFKDCEDILHLNGALKIKWHGLNPGVYQVVMALYEGMGPVLRQHAGEIKITSSGLPSFGVYQVPHEWCISKR